MKQSQNRLLPENCNKSQCKTCVFGPTPVKLTPERIEEIMGYITSFKSSHICHTTNLTCYGALELQAKILYKFGLIEEPTVSAFLKEAQKKLNLKPIK